MNDDELDRRLADYGATLDRAADEGTAARSAGASTVPLDQVASRRRRGVVWAAATVAALAAATVGVVVWGTRDGRDVTLSDGGTSPRAEASSTVVGTPATSTTVDLAPTSAPGSDPSTPPVGTADPSTTTSTWLLGSSTVSCDEAAISSDTGVELAALMGDCHGGWALGITPACAAVTEGECESAEAFAATTTGWRAVGPVYPFCVDPLVEASGMTVRTAVAFGAERCDPASSLDPQAVPATLRPGDSSADVRALQIALIAQGYRLTDDGTYGPATEAAVRDLQAREALLVDGMAGPATRAALEV